MIGEDHVKKLAKWLARFRRYTVTYKKGAYHLYNLFNSPQTMLDSFENTPFCHHDKVKKTQVSDTMFLKSMNYYCNPEDELWVFMSHLYFKKNVSMVNLYDRDLPVEYHFLNIHIKEKSIASKSLINGLLLTDRTWSMFKAGHAITEFHFKESTEKNITIFFTSRWLEKQKQKHPHFKNSKFSDFFESPNTYMLLEEQSTIYDHIHEHMMRLSEENSDGKNTRSIKNHAFEIIENFIVKTNRELIAQGHFNLNDKDRKNIQRAEQFLNEKLFGEFPGIDTIAKKIGISPTKLKNDFKCIHDTSLYKYFSDQQMKAAHQLITQKKLQVKDVAKLLGYENPSKFSAVFKKKFEVTPSDLMLQ
ncbi:hypothetical protein CNR22_22260 [Sphingobacteriaceae bacterium]|nr:hypothetical protein CNR22_22260 [Sphingobacteriaceae bacterium]